MPTPAVTVDEIIELLKHSNLATVLVEGNDDEYIFRQLERDLGVGSVDVLKCGGRTALLSIYERRAEFTNCRTAFFADRDLWLFTKVPCQYNGIVFTEGYSIENDLLGSGDFRRLFDAAKGEEAEFERLIKTVVPWFAFEVNEYIQGRPPKVDVHIDQLVVRGTGVLANNWVQQRGCLPGTHPITADLAKDYMQKLRGHLLLEILVRLLNAAGRTARYRHIEILEIPLKLGLAHLKWQRILSEVKSRLGDTRV